MKLILFHSISIQFLTKKYIYCMYCNDYIYTACSTRIYPRLKKWSIFFFVNIFQWRLKTFILYWFKKHHYFNKKIKNQIVCFIIFFKLENSHSIRIIFQKILRILTFNYFFVYKKVVLLNTDPFNLLKLCQTVIYRSTFMKF